MYLTRLGKIRARSFSLTFALAIFAGYLSGFAAESAAHIEEKYRELEKKAAPEVKRKVAEHQANAAARNAPYTLGITARSHVKAPVPRHPRATSGADIKQFNDANKERMDATYADRWQKVVDKLGGRISVNDSRLDWREHGAIIVVKFQGYYETCWDFAAVGALEASYSIHEGAPATGSEEHVLLCSGAGTAQDGGGSDLAIKWMHESKGVASGVLWPFDPDHNPKQPITGAKPLYHAAAWGYVAKGGDNASNVATTAEMKQALVDHGPICSAMYTDEVFYHYRNGPYNENGKNGEYNHDVVIIGWDDSVRGADGKTYGCWIVKNSWSQYWGSNCGWGTTGGFAYVAYDSAAIGTVASWVSAEKAK